MMLKNVLSLYIVCFSHFFTIYEKIPFPFRQIHYISNKYFYYRKASTNGTSIIFYSYTMTDYWKKSRDLPTRFEK